MDTFKDKQHLEELNQGTGLGNSGITLRIIPRQRLPASGSAQGTTRCGSAFYDAFELQRKKLKGHLRFYDIGAHSDDIEIGCGGTILRLADQYPTASFTGPCQSIGIRENEARRAAPVGFAGPRLRGPLLKTFQDGFMPYVGSEVKPTFENDLKSILPTSSSLTTQRCSHRPSIDLGTHLEYLRDHFILEYEIPEV